MKHYDIIIIGGGPAGLTAGLYASRANKSVAIVEGASIGGQIVVSPEVENYPAVKKTSGYDLVSTMLDQALDAGAELETDTVLSIEKNENLFDVVCEFEKFTAKSVIIAGGVKSRKLGLEGEAELLGHGVSYCAVCDGAFFRNRIVAVNGGGSSALEDALFLTNYCQHVYVIHRREEFRGEPVLVEQLKKKTNVSFVLNSVIQSLEHTDRLTGITVKHVHTGTLTLLDVDGLFVAIGKVADSQRFANLVDLDANGYIISDEGCTTRTAGLYCAGDCRTKQYRQLTTATADGTVAALKAINYCSLID